MKMCFVNIDDANFALTKLLKVRLKALNIRLALLRVRFAEQLLTLFPTEAIRFQECAQQISADITLENGFHPAP